MVMFEGFANVWTPVTLASRLGKTPLAVELAGEKLVFFRGRDGKVGALVDRCPHRGVRLSLGGVAPSGCLTCPFHGWEFDVDGNARFVPLNPDAKLDRLSATALPARELGGLLWVYTAPKSTPAEPIVPATLTDPKLARTYLEEEWNAHWTRAMENMLDSPHVPFVHRNTIGRFVRPRLQPNSRMDVEWEDTDFGGRTFAIIDNDRSIDPGRLEFYRPNIMVLHIPMPKQTFRMHAICVPVAAQKVRMIVVGARSFAKLSLLNPLFNYSNKRIVAEDRAVVESSDPPVVPPAAQEVSVRSDRATLAFRKYYFQSLHTSTVSVKRGLPVVTDSPV